MRRRRVFTPYENAVESYVTRLDSRRGAVFSSNYEYPGRYTRWDTAIADPPLGIEAHGREISVKAYNERGRVMLAFIAPAVRGHEHIASCELAPDCARFRIKEPEAHMTEEMRSRRPTVFSLLRAVSDLFHSPLEDNLALYGAFGYDLAFQFDDIEKKMPRDPAQRDLVLFLPDEILVVDHHGATAWLEQYDFSFGEHKTESIERESAQTSSAPDAVSGAADASSDIAGDHAPGEYARLVELAKEKFRRGDLFEVVPSRMFREVCRHSPAAVSRKLKRINPSPYSFFINLGEGEHLVGASPEMFVRVEARRIETCPISGTVKRGRDPIEDSEQILKLLNSKKDEAELTMCSDVDRNDKSRVCEPGSVKVIGRRQIEMYSRLIHTVDHIEGRLRENMDAFDGFLSHAWAVTVTGAPKLWAMRFIEEHEKSPRAWYGGAVGMVGFNGNMNTGLTLRTVRIKDGIAEVRAGATLLYDSDPDEEEAETELKASAMLDAVRNARSANDSRSSSAIRKIGENVRILLVDHEDSFVHTLANYFRQTGAQVVTLRTPVDAARLDEIEPDLIVLSPGPGCPEDFDCGKIVRLAQEKEIALFGVCLGQQAICEAHGARLERLDAPYHGKPSRIKVEKDSAIFSGLEDEITIGRYHSIYVDEATLPPEFRITAKSEDGVIMAVEHKSRKIAAVQFHPESIMSLGQGAGQRMIENIVAHLTAKNDREKR